MFRQRESLQFIFKECKKEGDVANNLNAFKGFWLFSGGSICSRSSWDVWNSAPENKPPTNYYSKDTGIKIGLVCKSGEIYVPKINKM